MELELLLWFGVMKTVRFKVTKLKFRAIYVKNRL